MSDLKTKLQAEIQDCTWINLDKNLERGAVFLIAPEIELVDAAVAVVEDQAQTIANWLENKQLLKLKPSETDTYNDKKFEFIITQPYVLVKIKN